jgi:type IV pilus assembly protein PilC
LEQYCYDCHDAETKKGDLDLTALSFDAQHLDLLVKVHDAVKEGESMVGPLEASNVFPPMVISMVDVGEETGQLPEMLLKIADVYEDEVDNSVSALTSMLEPLMIVMLALVVGTIVMALFLPLIEVIKGLSAG